jgi:hypothetical protein
MSKQKEKIAEYWLGAGFTHLSPSQTNLPIGGWVYRYAYLSNDERRSMGVGERAALGTACHNAIQAHLCHNASLADSIKQAFTDYDFHDANEDDVLRARLRDGIPDTIKNAVEVLADAGFAGCDEEMKITTRLQGLEIDMIGFIDLIVPDTMFCEIKTKGDRKSRKLIDGSQGWSKATLPKKPEYSHLMQVAVYQHATGLTPSICYTSKDEAVLYTPFNCDELKADSLKHALDDVRQRALIRQNLVKLFGSDAKAMASVVDPDWQHAYIWKIDDEHKKEARALWQQ